MLIAMLLLPSQVLRKKEKRYVSERLTHYCTEPLLLPYLHPYENHLIALGLMFSACSEWVRRWARALVL